MVRDEDHRNDSSLLFRLLQGFDDLQFIFFAFEGVEVNIDIEKGSKD